MYLRKEAEEHLHFAETEPEPPEKVLMFKRLRSPGTTLNWVDVPIKQFRWEYLKPDFVITADGQRRSGKSTWIRAFMKNTRRYWSEAYVFTGSKVSNEYENLVRNDLIFDNLETRTDGTGGMDMLLFLYYRNLERKKALQHSGKNDQNLNILVIIEDLVANEQSNAGFHHIPLFNKIAFNGRHAHICLVITSQNIKGVPPAIKQNTDACVLFGVNNERTKKAVRESFMDSVRDDAELDVLLSFLYEVKWSSAVVMRNDPRKHPNEAIFMGVPGKTEKDFVLGDRQYWYGAEAQLYRTGFGHLLDLPPEEWGIETVTYKFNPND